MTEAEVKTYYKALHDDLSESYYAGTSGLTKEQFDYEHAKIWDDMQKELILEGYIIVGEPAMDIPKEINEIKGRLNILERK